MKMSGRYKCTYTPNDGAACPVFFKYNSPHPSHCFAYDCKIWNINPDIVCEYCVELKEGEVPVKKIWCDSECDITSAPNEKECKNCAYNEVVFDPDADASNKEPTQHTPRFEIESPHELGFKKGESYWILGWTWMRLDKINRGFTFDGEAFVIYEFVGIDE
jgi:hypothetical protein